jgi:hypothetical protein
MDSGADVKGFPWSERAYNKSEAYYEVNVAKASLSTSMFRIVAYIQIALKG